MKQQKKEDNKKEKIKNKNTGNNKRNNSKSKRKLHNCILFVAIGSSIILVMIVGLCSSLFGSYSLNVSWDRPTFVSLVLDEHKPEVETETEILVTEEELMEEEESSEELIVPIIETIEEEETTTTEEETEPQISPELEAEYEEYYGETPFKLDEEDVNYYVSWENTSGKSPYYNEPGVRPVSSVYDYREVDASYYADTVFIGDSRVEGLHDYSGWEDTTFCYKVGLTVFTMFDKEINISRSEKSTVEEVLSSRDFKAVYLMIGINELGKGTVDDFAEAYKEAIDRIRELQPEAKIVIMGIMFETKEYSDGNTVYNNDNINAKNVAISKLADGKDIFYLDMNPAVCDETGGLTASYSFDGVHMKAQYYALWVDFMYKHGI